MAFILTLLYIAATLMSPGAFPDAITILHVNMILGLLTILVVIPSLPGAKLGSIPNTYLVLGVLLASLISMVATGWTGGIIVTLGDFVPVFIVFYFVAVTCKSIERLKILTFVLLLVAFFILAHAALAYHEVDATSQYLVVERVSSGDIVMRWRGLGVLSDPNDLAQFCVTVIPLLWLRWKKNSFLSNFLLTIVPAVMLSVGIYFTHSRGGAVALAAVVLFGFKDKLGVVGSSIVAGLFMIALVALNVGGGRGMDDDNGGRVAAWATGLEMLKSHPILGVGPGNFNSYNSTGLTAHNSFVLAMSELGLFGYFFWMGTIVYSWTGLSQIIRSRPAKVAPNEELSGSGRLYRPPMRLHPEVSVGASGVMARTVANPASLDITVPKKSHTWSQSVRQFRSAFEVSDEPDPDQLAYAAKVIRVSFVGLLTAGFFLSRTYAVSFYIVIGMAAVVIKMPETLPVMNIPALAKKIGIICVSSVILLYLFVRLHGGQ